MSRREYEDVAIARFIADLKQSFYDRVRADPALRGLGIFLTLDDAVNDALEARSNRARDYFWACHMGGKNHG